MKTMVLFHTPERLLYCTLSDLSRQPERGSHYVFDHTQYVVEYTMELLGGTPYGGGRPPLAEQLFDLLSVVEGNAVVTATKLQSMVSIGQPGHIGDSVLVSAKSTVSDCDAVLLVKLSAGQKVPKVDPSMRTLAITAAAAVLNGSGISPIAETSGS